MTALPAPGPLLGALLALACQGVPGPSDPERAAGLERGRVVVSLVQSALREGAVVSLRIANGREAAVYSEDSKSDCSIAMLERREDDTWRRVPGCSVERMPAVTAIAPGQTRTVNLDPHSLHFGVTAGSRKPAFGAGSYRIRFSYRLAPEPLGSEPEAVFSETFRIQP